MANATSAVENIFKEDNTLAIVGKTSVFIIIFIVAFVGNATIIAVIKKNANHRMRNTSNLFIANMAVSNLSLVIWNVPFTLSSIIKRGQWFVDGIFGRGLCKFCMFIWFVSEILACGSLSAIAVDRFLLVFFPTRQILNKKLAYASIVFSWLLGIGFSSPVFNYTDLVTIRDRLYCFMNLFLHDEVKEYITIIFGLFIASPIAILSFLYWAIILKLLGQKPIGDNVSNERREKKRKENYRTAVLLLVSVFVFAFCVLPFWVANMYCYSTLQWRSWVCSSGYIDISFMLTIVNAGVNPYIYLLFSQGFRNGARNLFLRAPVSIDEGSSLKHTSRKRPNQVEPTGYSVSAL